MTNNRSIPTPLTVLVEEDGAVRWHWSQNFRERNQTLLSFGAPESFLQEFCWILSSGSVPNFFLDQDFGTRRGLGTALARKIRTHLPTAKIALVTAYPEFCFTKELKDGVIDAVYTKYPKHIFGDSADEGSNFISWAKGRLCNG